MKSYFSRIEEYLIELDYEITESSEKKGLLVVKNEEQGIQNLVLGCADPILIMEQFIMEIDSDDCEVYKNLLRKNRDIIHGAFVLDDSGSKVIFRDTHELENLDLNELEATFNSLSLMLSEYYEELIKFSKSKKILS